MKFVSIIIPTYNRIALLKNCLQSFENINYPKKYFEVIVVDDGSIDGTEEFMINNNKFNFNLVSIRQKNNGPAAARNLGIAKAQGEFIAFTDDDCVVEKNWLDECIRSFDEDNIGGVGGATKHKMTGAFCEFMDFYKVMDPPVVNGEVLYLITANACYRRDAILAVNGFEEKIRNPGGEDPDLSMKVKEKGYKLIFNPNCVVYHFHKNSLKSFYRTFFNYGRGAYFLRDRWGDKLVKTPRNPIIDILQFNNLNTLPGYIKFAGFGHAIQLWALRSIQIYASYRGFKRGY